MALLMFFAITFTPMLHGAPRVTACVPAIYVFGDSLADVGNNNHLEVAEINKANFPHNGVDFPDRVSTGRFSNGYNGIDFIAKKLGFERSPPPYLSLTNVTQMLIGVNFASGGSGVLDTTGPGTITFSAQIAYFRNVSRALAEQMGDELAKTRLSESLFLISTANNDMFAYYYATGAKNTTSNDHFISSLVDKFENHLQSLYQLGGRRFWIAGAGKIGCIPFLRSRSTSGGCVEELNEMARRFNEVAMPRLNQLSLQLEGMKYSYTNYYDSKMALKMTPGALRFKELTSACCGGGKYNGASQCTLNASYCSNRDEHYFWDWFHPTQAAYKLVAQVAYNGTKGISTP
ncbi:GDSL esterase/lipase, partial [Ananas comosus]